MDKTLKKLKRLTPSTYAALPASEKEAMEADVCREFAASCFKDALRLGRVNPKGKSEGELYCELLKYTIDHLGAIKRTGLSLVIDHTQNLLRAARLHRRRAEHELAILLYATWAEHWLNGVIATACQRRKMHPESVEQMLRETPSRGKQTWVLELLGLRPLSATCVALLGELQALRNGFVHYKCKPQNEKALSHHETQLTKCLQRTEAMVRALIRYEDSCFFKKSRTTAVRLARQLRRAPNGHPHSSQSHAQDLPPETDH